MGTGPTEHDWHAVDIVTTHNGCDAASALAGKRFLSAAAPRVPLAQCPNPALCECTYQRYDDRRVAQRRTDTMHFILSDDDRRHAPGRRLTDR